MGGGTKSSDLFLTSSSRPPSLSSAAPHCSCCRAAQTFVFLPQCRSTPQARAREREFTIPKESPEDKRRSRALLTIQSVGVISAALSFGTLALCE